MRLSGSLTTLALTLATVSPLTAAWGPPQAKAMLVRADPSSTAAQSSATDKPADKSSASAGQSASSERPAQTNTAKPDSSKTDKGSASPTKSGDNASKTSNSSDNSDDSETSYPADAGYGAIVMTQPPVTAANTPLYRISEYVTLGWNYTALEAPPRAIDVYATQKDKQATFTLTQNMTFTTAVNFVWNTTVQANDPANPLFTAEYYLMIKDADKGFKDQTAYGHLFPNVAAFSFGLYKAADYVPLPEYICPGCSSGNTLSRSAGLAAVMGIAAAAVGAGVF